MQHQQMKDRLQNEYTRRLRWILKSELNAKNRIKVTGELAVPELRYSFSIRN